VDDSTGTDESPATLSESGSTDDGEAAEAHFDDAGGAATGETSAGDGAEAQQDADATSGDDSPTAGDDGDERDDVVVDLFARLRAGAAAPTEPAADDAGADTDETETPAAGASGAVAESTVVGDLEGDAGVGDEIQDGDESPFDRRDADLTPLIVASARKLKRVLADEQNGVLEVLRGDAGVRQLDEIVAEGDEQASRYAESITDELTEAARAGARSIAAEHELAEADAAAARAAAIEIVTEWLVMPLRDRLERCVDEGDRDNVAISRRIRSVYREWKTQHIDEQLDDVLRAAYGRGALGAADGGSALVWLVDRDHPACPDCDDNSLSPPVAAGEPFPTGHTFAPAHPGCRCLVALPDR
jgi:hypothetical protein